MDEQLNCKCGKPVAGWKCSDKDCGAKASAHDPEHKHNDVNTCEPCCSGCDEAQSNCSECSEDSAPVL